MSITKLNLACWSIGEHAQRNILPAVKKSSCIELKGVYTRNAQVLRNIGEQYSCKVYATPTDLLNDPDIEAVYISSPTSEHFHQIEQCLIHGKSVLVEKTALPDLDSALRCINLAREKGLFIMEAFMYRFHKQFSFLSLMLSDSKYGVVKKIDCEFGFPHLDTNNIRYKKSLDGGALFDAGAYTLSSIRKLAGERPQVISALVMSDAGYEVDTFGSSTLLVKDIIATATWGFGLSYSNRIRVWTDKVHIEVDRAYSKREEPYKIKVSANGNIAEIIDIEPDNHFNNMLTYFSHAHSNESAAEECLTDLLHQSELLSEVRELGARNEN